jgi:hypothetical protein
LKEQFKLQNMSTKERCDYIGKKALQFLFETVAPGRDLSESRMSAVCAGAGAGRREEGREGVILPYFLEVMS